MSVEFRCQDVFRGRLPLADAVYADPPYSGRADLYDSLEIDLARLIERMESIAPVRAMSMSQGMLPEFLGYRPGARICVWAIPFTQLYKRPAYSWEPVMVWGEIPPKSMDYPTVKDLIYLNRDYKKATTFKTPKPPEFARWIVQIIAPISQSRFVDLFSGSGSIASAAELAGHQVIAIDNCDATGVYRF